MPVNLAGDTSELHLPHTETNQLESLQLARRSSHRAARRPSLRAILWIAIAVQAICGTFFLVEILTSVFGLRGFAISWEVRELLEIGASVGLVVGAGLGIYMAQRSHVEAQRAIETTRMTAGEFAAVVEEHFKSFKLSDAEHEVAWLLLKGLSIGEIATVRQAREGTVRAQCTAIYRKSGVKGKSQLVAQLVEDLLL